MITLDMDDQLERLDVYFLSKYIVVYIIFFIWEIIPLPPPMAELTLFLVDGQRGPRGRVGIKKVGWRWIDISGKEILAKIL